MGQGAQAKARASGSCSWRGGRRPGGRPVRPVTGWREAQGPGPRRGLWSGIV